MALITYGDVKAELAEATENGLTTDDSRMISRVNTAQRAVARAMTATRGVFVGSTMSAIVTVNTSNKTFALPPEMDVAQSIESASGAALPNGWYQITSADVLVNPDDMMDTAFVDLGVNQTTGVRSYQVPELAAGVNQLLVYGLKAFSPVVNDASPLYVQNVEAVKWWLLSLFKGQKADDRAGARDLRALAVEDLTAELMRHLDDPSRYAARLAQWRVDENTYGVGTLGNVAARMALDFANGQKIGRIRLYRLVNEAAREAVLSYNALGAEQRYTNDPGPNQLTFVRALNPTDLLAYFDYEVLMYLVKAQGQTLKPEEVAVGKAEAQKIIARNLGAAIDAARNTARNARLGLDASTMGYISAKMGLELPTQALALTYSDNQFRRWINEAARQAITHYNYLGRSERYSNVNGPTSLTFTAAANDAAVVSYPDYEVLSLLVRAQITEVSGPDAEAARTQARELIERNLAAVVESARTSSRYQRLTSSYYSTLSYLTAKMGLEIPTPSLALTYSDSQLRRWLNEAAARAIEQYNFLGRTERYTLTDGPAVMNFVFAATDDATLSYTNFEVLALLVQEQIMGGMGAESAAVRAKAFETLERNLAADVDAARNRARQARRAMAPRTLGYLSARLGLEAPDPTTALTYSDGQLRRMTNEAAREALQQRDFLSRTERYSNLVTGPEQVTFVYADDDINEVSYPDLEVLRRLVVAQIVADAETARGLRTEAFALVERNLQKWIEATRNQVWHCLIKNTPAPMFGGVRARIGLEYGGDGGEDGYKLSDMFMARMVRDAWAMAVDHFNFLSRSEDYEQSALVMPPTIPADDAVVPFPMEVLKLYAEAAICQDKNEEQRAAAYKGQAASIVERNLTAFVERARRVACEAQMLTDQSTFGYVVGRLGLDLPGGFAMSEAKRRRLVNEAEEFLSDSGRWKFMEGEYFLAVDTGGNIVAPADVETVIYAERHGGRVEMKDRKWLYGGWAVRNGVDCWEGWSFNCNVPLYDGGYDTNRNHRFRLGSGCLQAENGVVAPLRALCRRKWVLKVTDADLMLVVSYPAVKAMVESLLYRRAGDAGNSEHSKNSALKTLDNQLAVQLEGQVPLISVNMPGLPRGGMYRGGRRAF